MATINQTFKNGQEYLFSISQVPEISTDTAVINFVGDTSGNLTARKISDTVFGLTYNGSSKTFTSNIQLVINGVSGYAEGLIIYIDINGTLAKDPVRIYNPSNYTVSVDIYRSSSSAPTLDIYYCVGSTEGTYTHYTNSTDYGTSPVLSISVAPKQSVWVYSDTMTSWAGSYYQTNYINIRTPDYSNNYDDIKMEISGNIMSLINGNQLTIGAFSKLFMAFKNLSKVSSNFLPVTKLSNGCYYQMFYNCTHLTTAPALPATTLENSCYGLMFGGCSSLTTAPYLPATTLASSCYANMFQGCTALTTAPELLATTLYDSCYFRMFADCTSLTTAPVLSPTTLARNCYDYMFSGCTKLNYVKALFLDTPAGNNSSSDSTATDYWLQNVASTGKFVKNHEATWDVRGNGAIPYNWTVITELEDFNEN